MRYSEGEGTSRHVEAKRKGRAIATADGLIAATAVEHALAIVTRNVQDLAETGVAIINPWQP